MVASLRQQLSDIQLNVGAGEMTASSPAVFSGFEFRRSETPSTVTSFLQVINVMFFVGGAEED